MPVLSEQITVTLAVQIFNGGENQKKSILLCHV
jgi:hypothetical protein